MKLRGEQMADEKQEAPVDDAAIVHDDPVAVEEQEDSALAKKVAKLLDPETPDEKSEEPGQEPEATADEGEGEKEVEIDEKLQSRAKQAGLTDEVAKQLHESGQLKEVLTAFNRKMVEYVQSKEEPAKEEGKREETPPPKDQEEVPALDPDVYDEAIVKRDQYQTNLISEQAKRLEALESQFQQYREEQEGTFDGWMDGVIADLGGNVNDADKCQETWKFYQSLCLFNGANPYSQNRDLAEQAFEATHPEVKAKKTVDRLRDAEGKFLSSQPSKQAPPAKRPTDDEVHEDLVAKVAGYLKEQNVETSGYY